MVRFMPSLLSRTRSLIIAIGEPRRSFVIMARDGDLTQAMQRWI